MGWVYDVAERMGLLDELAQQQLPFEDIVYVDAKDSPIAHIDIALMGKIMRKRIYGADAFSGLLRRQFGVESFFQE